MFKKSIHLYFVSLMLFFSVSLSWGWGSTGHQLVAMIAYDYLKPPAKQVVDRLTLNWSSQPPLLRFLHGATYPDELKFDDIFIFNEWHFIDYPYSEDGTPVLPVKSENIVWAIGQSEEVLRAHRAKDNEKAYFLSLLEHFIGDVHQPLHCVTMFSREFPQGDRGGNSYHIHADWAKNLHGYWDQGLGLLRRQGNLASYLPSLQALAKTIETTYPEKSFMDTLQLDNPEGWAQQSFNYAKTFAYTTPENEAPNDAYVQRGQQIVKQQIALAGYRLAETLNTIFP